MRAVVIESFGEPDVLVVDAADLARGAPGRGGVDALNRADLLQRRGLYPGPPRSRHPGHGVRRTALAAVGSRVIGQLGGPARHGDHRRARRAAGGTARRRPRRCPRRWRSNAWARCPRCSSPPSMRWWSGAASGRGARSSAPARRAWAPRRSRSPAPSVPGWWLRTTSKGKVEACRELGATVVVDYGSTDFVEAALEHTGGRGVDVVLNMIGGDYLDRERAGAPRRRSRRAGRVMGGDERPRSTSGCCCPRTPPPSSAPRCYTQPPPLEEKIAHHPALRPGTGAALRRRSPRPGHGLPLPARRRGRGAPPHGVQRQRRQDSARGATRLRAAHREGRSRPGAVAARRRFGERGALRAATWARPPRSVRSARLRLRPAPRSPRAAAARHPGQLGGRGQDGPQRAEDHAGDVCLPRHPTGSGCEEPG